VVALILASFARCRSPEAGVGVGHGVFVFHLGLTSSQSATIR
jgi:hypothetical protein